MVSSLDSTSRAGHSSQLPEAYELDSSLDEEEDLLEEETTVSRESDGVPQESDRFLGRRFSPFIIDRWERQPPPEGEYRTSTERVLPSDLQLLDLDILYTVRPEFMGPYYTPPLEVTPREDTPRYRAIRRLVEKEGYRQARRLLKREWRRQLKEMPNLTYNVYEPRLLAINKVGRDRDSFDQTAEELYTSQVREDVFGRGVEGEEEFPVIQWGPLVLLDSGSVNIDATLLKNLVSGDFEPGRLEVAPERKRSVLFSGEQYKVNTRVRLDVNPLKVFERSDVLDMFRSYGAVVEVTWFTDILKRERFSTEAEIQYRRSGELVVFFNFVLRSR